ncbi:MAG: carboxymuconolactone decarboxylase family protein [Castellaniella sp.]|uniref:carboxymuconolactone decarboxylase family protein n=1 Tax=Castellaniella sp. TaxID=1955812 RepID=UPI003C73C241
MTVSSYKQLTQTLSSNLAPLRKTQADLMKGFNEMGAAAMAGGSLDPKTKELIALAVGVAARCDGCIGFHTKALARLGASTEEVHEALGVAIYMGGGPAAMYAANAVAAFQEFTAPVPA